MDDYVTADIPDEFKGLRACLRCSLIKTFEQVCSIISEKHLGLSFIIFFSARHLITKALLH